MKNRLMTAVALALLGGGLLAGSSAFAATGDTGASFDKVTSTAVTAREFHEDSLAATAPNAPAAIAPYCENTYTSSVEPITLVKINDIENASDATVGANPPHEDFTAVLGTLRPGSKYAVTMKSNTDGASFSHGHALYVDWNQDGDFDDADEGYWIGTITGSTGVDAKSVTAVITVPAGATLGDTRMRAMTAYNATALSGLLPCRTGTGYGQSEDYTVTLDPSATVLPFAPTMTMAFSPATGTVPFTSTLSFAFGNTNNDAPATLTADFVNTLPAGLEVATPSNAATTCGGTLTAADGAGSFTLASGGTVPDGGCTLSVDISATSGGNYTYTVPAGALATDMGDGPGASAALTAIGGVNSAAYSTGFEAPFTVGALNLQQGWSARTWTVSDLQPANGAQHLRAVSLASPTTSTQALAISPTFAIGTAPYATISANINLSRLTNGATWRFNPQDPAAGLVTTILQFERSTTRNIQAITFDALGNGTFVNTGAFWPIDTYFNFKAIVNRDTGALKLCMNGAQIYEDGSGNGTAGLNIANVAISQATGTGQTANNTMLVDDLVVEYVNSYDCVASTHTVTPSVGAGNGSISPNTVQTVNYGDAVTFTLAADAGFEIDNVGGTCGGTLTGSSYQTNMVIGDCTVIANFKALPVIHTVTPSVGTPSGSISPNTAQTVVDGATATFTLAADTGYEIDNVGGDCPAGSFAGNDYTTGAITADCTVVANFKAVPASTHVRISQIYGGGGNTGATFNAKYVELFNPGSSAVALTGMSVQYAAPAGTNWSGRVNLTGTIGAHSYFLVQLGSGANGAPMPVTPDQTSTSFSPGGTNGNLALANVTTALACQTTACASDPQVVDLVGFGTGAAFEGTAAAPATSATLAAFRAGDGCIDSNDNAADFSAATPAPRNSTSPANTCGAPPVTHTVTPSVGTPSGAISPNTAQTVNDGDTAAFTLTPDTGFEIDAVGGTCGGTLDTGTSVYTTAAVTADCTVVANFKAIVVPGDPIIDVTPASLSASQEPNQTTTQTLLIENIGGSDLNWGIEEGLPRGTGTGTAERMSPRLATPRQPAPRDWALAPMAEVVQDGGFEAGDPNPFWTVASLNFGSPLCTAALCGTGGGLGPRTGTWWTWLGGIAAVETASVQQDLTISAGGPATLSFWLNVSATSGDASDYMAVLIDSNEVFRVTADNVAAYASGYAQVVIDVSAYADDAVHTLKFDSSFAGTDVTNFMVDDVSLDAGAPPVSGCTAGDILPWASVDTGSGTIAAGGNATVTVTFDSTGLAVGTYSGLLCVNSNDPVNPQVEVPVELTVAPPAGGLVCFSQSHSVAQTFDGTYVRWEDNTFSDTGSITGSNFNPYGATQLSFFWPNSSTGNAGVASATTGGTWLVLNPGDTVGPASTFNTATTGATNWRAGADGYLGFRFACSTASACYGYAHMTTVAPNGYPAVIGDYCFDSTGAAITIPGGIPRHTVTPSVGSPSGTITPDTPQLVDEGTTAAFTLSPALGYHILDVTGTCGGTLAGNTFTTDAVMADCTVVANFEINAAGTDPVIGVTPAAGFSVSQNTNQTTTDTLTIGNSGGGDLNWTIKEENLPRPLSAMPVVERVQQAAQERVGAAVRGSAPAQGDAVKLLLPQAPEAVLHDNGPLTTNAGAGAGGADASALQTAVGNTGYGSNVSVSGGFRVADDFAVPAGGWMVDAITVFAYQTGSTTTSTMNAANLRIWDGVPGAAGSNIVFGDTTTNRLAATAFSGIYRTLDTDLTNADRPIMSVDISVGAILPEGTYWVDWQLGGSLASGPWAPAVTLSGQTGKPGANALQWDGTAWVAATDGGSMAAQDYPFQVNGTPAGGAPACTYLSSIPWLSASPATGTTAAAGSTAVTMTFDSTGVAIGSYAGNICVESNDPANPMVAVPVALDVVPVGATFTVTPSVGAGNGTISPSTAVIVDENGTTAFTLTPGAGYQLGTVGGTCGGTLAGNVFTTAPVTADCSVIANFDAIFPAPYCNVAFPSAVEPISRVVFTGIDNPSDPTVGGSPALENFLSVTGGVVSLDGLYDIAVEGNTGGNYTTKVRAYIDWNQNGSFADAGEMYNLSDLVNSTGADGKQATGSIVVPATATLGTTRMRVIKKFNTAADPCNTAGYGQAEDYTLTVNNDPLPQPEAQVSPISLSLTAQVGTSDTGTLTVSNVGPGRLTFNITRALPEAQGTPESMRGESVTRATVESLAARAAKLGSTLPFAVQDDLIGAYARGGDLPQLGNAILANDPLCDVGTPGLVVHDGNGAPDNGYGWNTTAGTDAKIVDKFTPSAYPASYSTVCVSLLTNAGLTSAPVQVVVFADDGAGGAPGTELGRVSATANNISSALDQSFQAIDISGMGLNIASGSVYIGLEWNAETVSGLYLASDETTAVDAGGYSYSGGAWGATADGFPDYKSMFIRAIEVAAGPPGTGCGSPSAISWLSAAPLSGTINGPGSVAVTVTANAASLAVGTHQALLCVNTNDLAAPQFEIPVTFTVTPLPPAIFSDGFEGDDPPVDPNIVTGMINLPVALGDGDGLTMDFAAGLWGTYDPGRSDNVNLYDYGDGTLSVYWYGDVFTGVGGVVDGGGTEFAVLGSGATVGPASTISAASLKLVNWVGGVDGYLGFAFINSSTSQVNYGYIRMTTVSPGGLPAQVLEYGYNSAGAAITIP